MGKKKVVEPVTQKDMTDWSQLKAAAKATKKAYEDVCAKIRAAHEAGLTQEAGTHSLNVSICDEFATFKYAGILEELMRLGAVVPRDGKLVPLVEELKTIKATVHTDGEDKGKPKFYSMSDRMTVELVVNPTI